MTLTRKIVQGSAAPEPFTSNPDARRQRVTVLILSAVVIMYVLGGGQIKDTFSILGSGIEFQRPWVLVAGFIAVFLYSRWRFGFLARNLMPKAARLEMDRYFLSRSVVAAKTHKSVNSYNVERQSILGTNKVTQLVPPVTITYRFLSYRLSFQRLISQQHGNPQGFPQLGWPEAVAVVAAPIFLWAKLQSYYYVLRHTQIGSDYLFANLMMSIAMWLGGIRILQEFWPSIIKGFRFLAGF